MIRFTEIQDKFLSLIGWELGYAQDSIELSSLLTASESGLYYNYAHPLLTIENLLAIAPNFNTEDTPGFEKGRLYKKGELVLKSGKVYKALCAVQGLEPGTSRAEEAWVRTSHFSEWLESKTRASIHKAVSRYCNEQLASGMMKSICEDKVLFEGAGRLSDTIKNKKSFVGFELVPVRSKGISLVINKIGLQFTKPGTYILYLMHSSGEAPIKTVVLTKKKANTFEWFKVNLILPYISELTDAGGSWYIGYFQADLPENSEAIKKDKDWSKGPCSACSRTEYASWQAWSKYLEVHPFAVETDLAQSVLGFSPAFSSDFAAFYEPSSPARQDVGFDGYFASEFKASTNMWDPGLNQYDYTTNFGLNLDISVHCDLTDFIIQQRSAFVDILSKQLAVDMLREFVYNANVRANRHAINASKSDILYALDGEASSFKRSGLSYELELALKALKISLQGLDRVCLPCKNNGIKYRAI